MKPISMPVTLVLIYALILFSGILLSGCETLKEIELEDHVISQTSGPTTPTTTLHPTSTPIITSTTSPQPTVDNETFEPNSMEKKTPSLSWRPNAEFLIKDSIASLNPSYPDNVFLIVITKGVPFPPERIEINIYYEDGELIDTLTFNKGIKIFTSAHFKSSRIEGNIQEGNEIIIKEGSGFDLSPGVTLKVEMAENTYHSVFFESQIQVN